MNEDIEDPFDPPLREDYRIPRKNYAAAHQHAQAPKRNDVSFPAQFNNRIPTGPRKGTKTFKGGRDDLVSGNIEPASSLPSPKGPAAAPSAPGKRPEILAPGTVALNRNGDRVDLPLPVSTPQDRQRLTIRTKDRHLCNEHHLAANCHNPLCHYDHQAIDAGMLLALRHLVRTRPCEVGSGCRMLNCWRGHHCPLREGGKECKNSGCLFRRLGLHRVRDVKVVEVIPGPGGAQ